MTAAWAGMCCSDPPAIGISLRKATYTYGNLMDRKAFTVNVPSEDMVAEADYFGMTSGRDQDKFATAGLTPVRSELVDAPYVEECAMVLECRSMKTLEIGLHTQFIGEIMDVKVDEGTLDGKDICQISKIRPFVYAHDDHNYYRTGDMIARRSAPGRNLIKKIERSGRSRT